jgi:hypothetical protein
MVGALELLGARLVLMGDFLDIGVAVYAVHALVD